MKSNNLVLRLILAPQLLQVLGTQLSKTQKPQSLLALGHKSAHLPASEELRLVAFLEESSLLVLVPLPLLLVSTSLPKEPLL